MPQHGNPGYARPTLTAAANAEKPPLPPNRPPQSHSNTTTTIHRQPPIPIQNGSTMKPSYSLDERTYSHMTIAAHVHHEPPAYAAPEDPEPDYFSDEDRTSYSSSGRGASVASSVPSTPSALKAQTTQPLGTRRPVQRMMSQPPPPPPPPATPGTAGTSFADAIAKAAQARTAKSSQMPHVTSAPVLSATMARPNVAAATVNTVSSTPAPKVDDFQSELMRAIQRRSQEKEEPVGGDGGSRRSSSTDVDQLSATATGKLPPGANASSVKDRITFLERQKASAVKAVRLSGITVDQSSTDGDVCENSAGRVVASGLTMRAGVQHNPAAKSGRIFGDSEDGGATARFAVQTYQARATGGGGGAAVAPRDHDSASINSQSSASTLSSGYESPTLKYGSAGEHLWTNGSSISPGTTAMATAVGPANPQHGRKFTPGTDVSAVAQNVVCAYETEQKW